MPETMRERLERLKNSSSGDFESLKKEEQPSITERKFFSSETVYMKKVEKMIHQIESLRTKMHSGTDQYISLYQELKKAEEDFLSLTQDLEQKSMDLPAVFLSRVEEVKKKLLTKKGMK